MCIYYNSTINRNFESLQNSRKLLLLLVGDQVVQEMYFLSGKLAYVVVTETPHASLFDPRVNGIINIVNYYQKPQYTPNTASYFIGRLAN